MDSPTKIQEPGSIVEARKALSRRSQTRWLLLLAGPLLFLLTFYFYPIARMLAISFFDPDFTMKHYLHLFKVPAYSRVLIETFKMAASVTSICLVLGYPVAYLLAETTPRVRSILMLLVIMPFMVSILVRTYAWMVILGRHGVINEILMNSGLASSPIRLMHNLFGVYVGMVQVLLPFMIFPLYSIMAGIDKRLMKAAENLGANPTQVFIRIFLPLSLPGVGGGCILVFIIALGFFITPALLGGVSDVMISTFIETQVNTLLNWGFASAMSVVLLIITFVLFFIYTRYFGMEQAFAGEI
jgi:putative spermidine/putrescine transport system permease protein